MAYRVVIWKDGKFNQELNLIDGDSVVFEPPNSIEFYGKNAVLKWKLKKAERANEVLRNILRDATSREVYDKALRFDRMMEAASENSLASDGLEMIQSAMRDR